MSLWTQGTREDRPLGILSWRFLSIGLLCIAPMLHAEQGCPAGMVPEGGPGTSSCRPLPGAGQGGAQALSGEPRGAWVSRWGAIAMDKRATRVSAASRNRGSRKEAEAAAVKGCLEQGAKQCEIISAYANGCAALASSESRFAVVARNTATEAESAAMAQCQDATCQIIYNGCSQAQFLR